MDIKKYYPALFVGSLFLLFLIGYAEFFIFDPEPSITGLTAGPLVGEMASLRESPISREPPIIRFVLEDTGKVLNLEIDDARISRSERKPDIIIFTRSALLYAKDLDLQKELESGNIRLARGTNELELALKGYKALYDSLTDKGLPLEQAEALYPQQVVRIARLLALLLSVSMIGMIIEKE